MDFKIIENGVVVEEDGFHIFVPKHMLDTINNEAQKEWYYKQDVVDYLKEHYNYSLLLSEAPEVIDDLVELYAGLRKINEGCFNWEECLKHAFEHNEGEIDWENHEQEKWVLSYDSQIKFLGCYLRSVLSDIGQIYFSSRKIAQEAVEAIGKDRIEKYLFNIN